MAELVAQVFYQVDDGLQGQEEAAGEGYGAAQAITDTEGQEEQGGRKADTEQHQRGGRNASVMEYPVSLS